MKSLLDYVINLAKKELIKRGILDDNHTRASLKKERARADRNNQPFSVVLFSIKKSEFKSMAEIQLGFILSKRLRITDEYGWYNKNLCLILPNTTQNGALKISREIMQLSSKYFSDISFKIFSYPDRVK